MLKKAIQKQLQLDVPPRYSVRTVPSINRQKDREVREVRPDLVAEAEVLLSVRMVRGWVCANRDDVCG